MHTARRHPISDRHAHASPGRRAFTRMLAPLAVACGGCARAHLRDSFEASLHVCTHCGHHHRVGALQRAQQLADLSSLSALDVDAGTRDPLLFDDGGVSYADRIVQVRQSTGMQEAIGAWRGVLGGTPCMLLCMDFEFLGGSLGSAAGELFVTACEVAASEGRAVIAVCTSGGARMQEGAAALGQMARCTVGVHMLADAGLPYVCVLTDPCFGGVTASFAALGDVIIAEPGARIGFAGRRVIQQAANEELPDGFQTAEFLAGRGMVDMVVDRRRLRAVLIDVLDALTSADIEAAGEVMVDRDGMTLIAADGRSA